MKSTKTKTKSLAAVLFKKSKSQGVPIKLLAPSAKEVAVAGTFNNWQASVTRLEPAPGGQWRGEIKLPPGRYEYLFVVDGQWMLDPTAHEAVPNPFGGLNSVVCIS